MTVLLPFIAVLHVHSPAGYPPPSATLRPVIRPHLPLSGRLSAPICHSPAGYPPPSATLRPVIRPHLPLSGRLSTPICRIILRRSDYPLYDQTKKTSRASRRVVDFAVRLDMCRQSGAKLSVRQWRIAGRIVLCKTATTDLTI